MKFKVQHLSRRALTPALTLALSISAIGPAAPAVHAEPKQPDTSRMTVPCRDDNGRWVEEGKVVIVVDEDGVGVYQCIDGGWEEIMGRAMVSGKTARTATLRGTMLSAR